MTIMLRAVLAVGLLCGASLEANAARSVFYIHLHVATITGHQIRLLNGLGMKTDCSIIGMADIHIVSAPTHGWTSQSTDAIYPGYQPPDPRAKCPKNRMSGPVLLYAPSTTYVGHDFVEARMRYPDGAVGDIKIDIEIR